MGSPVTGSHDADSGGGALLIIDMINDLDFEGGDEMAQRALAAADRIFELRAQASAAGAPVIYANDNFGQWHSEKSKLVEHAGRAGATGAAVVERLAPRDDDLFVIKPMHSGFYATNLAVLLPKLGVSRLVLTGMATELCVLFTAADAHMRDYDLWIPGDCVAAIKPERSDWVLDILREEMGVETRPTSQLTFRDWLTRSGNS